MRAGALRPPGVPGSGRCGRREAGVSQAEATAGHVCVLDRGGSRRPGAPEEKMVAESTRGRGVLTPRAASEEQKELGVKSARLSEWWEVGSEGGRPSLQLGYLGVEGSQGERENVGEVGLGVTTATSGGDVLLTRILGSAPVSEPATLLLETGFQQRLRPRVRVKMSYRRSNIRNPVIARGKHQCSLS